MSTTSFPIIDLAATGINIVRLRKKAQLTVKDLQEYFGFSDPRAIYQWQNGCNLPSVDNLCALSKVLGVTIDEILVLKETTDPPSPPDSRKPKPRKIFMFLMAA